MAHHYHAIVWIDHTEAKIFHFNVEHAEKAVVRAHQPMRQIHHKANSIGSGHATENQTYYHAVANEIEPAPDVGPALRPLPGGKRVTAGCMPVTN